MSDDENFGFRINKSYAENYNRWRQKEEYQKLKDKYGDVGGSDNTSSSSEEEDEDAEELTPQLEKDWLKTLSALKSKDPRIYDKNVNFYHSEDVADKVEKGKKSKEPKPMFLKDYERKVILEKGGHLGDESSDEEGAYTAPTSAGPSYFEEQADIKESFHKAVADEDSDSDSDILVKRSKTTEEEAKEEEDYLQWLKSQPKDKDEEKAGIEELVPLRDYWADPNLQKGEKFLRDYILNKRYLGEDDERIPTYDEIVEEGFSEEEEQLEKEEDFERKYNFRFEQPDEEFMKRFPRTIDDSVRRNESKRSEKRKEVQDRKEQEKAKKREEIKQLKKLKKKEIQSKLDRIREITGDQTLKLTSEYLEEDFDPEKYDQTMQSAFDDDYYEGEDDAVKPVFSDDEELGLGDGHWSNWQGGQEEPHCDDPNFIMDADFIPEQQPKKKKKKKGKKNMNDDGEDDEEFEELYKLDYEDIIGDMPCRFQYREVLSNDYGLETDEILHCPDRELNAWASLKKSLQYRTEEEEHWDVRAYRKRGANMKKKMNVLPSLRPKSDTDEEEDLEKVGRKKKPKKKNNNQPPTSTVTSSSEYHDAVITDQSDPKPKEDEAVIPIPKKKRKLSDAADQKDTDKRPSALRPVKKAKLETGGASGGVPSKGVTSNTSKDAGDKLGQSAAVVGKSKKKKKKKKKKVPGKKQQPILSEERIKAYGFNPNKFKHTVMKKMQQGQKR